MEVSCHPLVQRDVLEALKYYTEISPRLADEFNAELSDLITKAAGNPLLSFPCTESEP